jgi:membrane protease subunit HflK
VHGLNHQLKSIFGRRRRRQARLVAYLWLCVILLAGWALSGLYVVDAGDRGVSMLLGRYHATTAPGLHWHAPWPLGSSEIVSSVDPGIDYVRGYSSLLTADGNIVSAEVSVHYQIVDVRQYLFGSAGPGDVLANLTDAAVSVAVARTTLTNLLGRGVEGTEADARRRLAEDLQHYPAGLIVTQLQIRKLQVPGAASTAYAAVRQAEQDAQKQGDEARAYADDVLPRARGEAESRVEAARAYAEDAVKRAQGEADGFGQLVVAYHRAPAVTRESLFLSTYEQILAQVDKVVVLGKGGQVTLSLERPAAQAAAPQQPKRKAAAGPSGGGGP